MEAQSKIIMLNIQIILCDKKPYIRTLTHRVICANVIAWSWPKPLTQTFALYLKNRHSYYYFSSIYQIFALSKDLYILPVPCILNQGVRFLTMNRYDTFTRTPVRVSKINSAARAQLTLQMLTLFKKYQQTMPSLVSTKAYAPLGARQLHKQMMTYG